MTSLDKDMHFGLADLIENIHQDYERWKILANIESDCASITAEIGSKYIKIISSKGTQRSVWGFIVNTTTDKKFKYGDILRAAGWAAPARNKPRGNIIDGGYKINWTGPNYL